MKKPFKEMTQKEIDNMSNYEFYKISPFEKKSCYDCGHIEEVLSLWCGCKPAIKSRCTSIPGCIKCDWWIPNWNYISKKYRTEENGYVKTKVEKLKEKFTKYFQRKKQKEEIF